MNISDRRVKLKAVLTKMEEEFPYLRHNLIKVVNLSNTYCT